MKSSKHISKTIILIFFIVLFCVLGAGFLIAQNNSLNSSWLFWPFNTEPKTVTNTEPITTATTIKESLYQSKVDYEQKIINAVKQAENSVVSIVATKDLPIIESYYYNPFKDFFGDDDFGFYFQIPQNKQKGTQKKEVSSGSGFVVDPNGYIITNRHVVEDTQAEYTVLLNDGSKHKATVVSRDPSEDFALVKIDATGLKPLKLGTADNLELGQTAIAIGNALGEFQNTVSVGVISGLHRSVQALDDNGNIATLNDVIQTDAAINPGNSGGPLLNLNGEVIGVNVAIVRSAQNIGFAIPINKIKNILNDAIKTGKITVPFIGICHTVINSDIAEKEKLAVDYGAWITKGKNCESAISPNSPAANAGLKENDIILSINGIKITEKNPLTSIIRNFSVGDTVKLEILRDNRIINISLKLGSR